ncbi:hypothetical protein GQ41_1302 [Arenibacter algicola]|uniref:Cthe-2314-like HEPN domain-containing protein n=1 Tax=Arenibacter algicola TaxID=616991 RepID=A0ABY3A833_9FLAO
MSRDINETKFSFKAFRNLKKGLGEFDAVVECNEMAIREFLNNLKASQDQKQFIQDLSNKHEVRVDSVNIVLFSSRIRLFYIMSVMQQAEQFIDEFRKEYKTYNPTWTNKVDGETDFDNLLQNIFSSKGQGITEIGKEVYYGFEYYRFVRNRFAHSEEKDLKKLNNLCKKVTEFTDYYNSKFHSVNCPNSYEKIDFNDFLLFTNIIKNIGYTLCEKCKPDNSQLAERIAKLEIEIDNKTIKPIKSINKLKNDPKRYSNAIGNLLNSNFGKINSSDRDKIIEHLKTAF